MRQQGASNDVEIEIKYADIKRPVLSQGSRGDENSARNDARNVPRELQKIDVSQDQQYLYAQRERELQAQREVINITLSVGILN
jgi:hypothetical protein